MGGEEQQAFLRCRWVIHFQRGAKSADYFLREVFPLTPNPSPQKFGVSLIRLDSVIVRISGERGVIIQAGGGITIRALPIQKTLSHSRPNYSMMLFIKMASSTL